MKPAHPDPGEMLQRVRQQLILAQVRIMELEDVRDEAGARLSENEKLLRAAQVLADQKLDEAAHSEKNRADLQAQFVHLQHIHQVASEALEAARARLAAAEQALPLEKQFSADLAAKLHQFDQAQQQLARQLREVTASAAARQQRIEQLDTEIRGMKASRSWQWTAWLRSLERGFRGKKP